MGNRYTVKGNILHFIKTLYDLIFDIKSIITINKPDLYISQWESTSF